MQRRFLFRTAVVMAMIGLEPFSRGQVPPARWERTVPEERIWKMAISTDGQWLATGGGSDRATNRIRIWRTADGSLLNTFDGHTNAIIGLAFSPDGRWLASMGRDEALKLWSLAEGARFVLSPKFSIATPPRWPLLFRRMDRGWSRAWPAPTISVFGRCRSWS